MRQFTFADSESNNKRRKTRKEIVLLSVWMPWDKLLVVIEPFHPKAGKGRRRHPLSIMFRIHCMQHWYNMSDPAIENSHYEVTTMSIFTGLSLVSALFELKSWPHYYHEF